MHLHTARSYGLNTTLRSNYTEQNESNNMVRLSHAIVAQDETEL